MVIMKKDVNFIFFILIIATVVSFAGFTAYYQVSFRNINADYNTKLAELNKVTKDLLDKKALLMQTSLELNNTKQGREELGDKYDDLKLDRDTLKDERDTLKENLYKTTADLAQKTTQVESLSAQLIAEQKRADDLKIDRDYYKNKYEECDDALG
ncbi:MAG: hypothetical protein KKC75_07325 [Nanoarchaeota archaeon]|nr:hypothetical protein [Nanoarchaeota archaeon]MBU1004545.1 hypothetical protein [Nanoarchaeota archaeon]